MKKIFSILFLSAVASLLHGQNVNFEWAKQMGGTDLVDARGLSIATDALGNVYTTGFFEGKVDFDPGSGIYNLDPLDSVDLYISKLDSSGKFLWAKQMDVSLNSICSRGRAITIDALGYIYITGDFLNANHSWNCYVSKLDTSGNFIWTKQLGESSTGTSIKVDAFGNVYIAGLLSGAGDFDPGPLLFNLGGFGGMAFVSKLDGNGNFVWAKGIHGYSPGGGIYGQITDEVSLALDGSQNIYISGTFFGTVDFDPGVALYNLTTAGTTGTQDIFVSKLDGNGNFTWAKQMGGTDNDYSVSIAVDGSGNVYTAGNFSGMADFDPGTGIYNLVAANGVSNTFISRLDRNGNFIWAKQFVGGSQWCYSMTLDNTGNIYTTGYFGTTLDFDPGPGTYNLSASGYNMFVSKLDGSGNFVWAKQIGGTATIISNSIAVDAIGDVYTTGYFLSGQVDFDPGAGTYVLTSGDGDNIFVHKLSQCLLNSSFEITESVCNNYTLNGQTYNTSGVYTQTLVNAAGCDSIITLNLTITSATKILDIATCKNFYFNNHIYSTSGTYIDTLITTNGCDSIITLNLTITPLLSATITQSICVGQTFEGHTASGTYIDTLVTADGCDSITILKLTVLSSPFPYLGADTVLCAGDSLLLYPGKFITYTWQDGSVQDHTIIKTPGLYSVTVTDSCGSATDEITIKEGVCNIYFPTAFSPNNDGKNDVFKILGANNLTGYHLSVYNRWGQKVFETFDYSKGWDGYFNGQLQSVETFIWYCEFKKQGDANKTKKKGIVTLVR